MDIQLIMTSLFIALLVLSIWKIYVFLPNKVLKDDDTTKKSEEELIFIMLKTIKNNKRNISISELLIKMKENQSFDSEHFWRFNENRLTHLLNSYYLKHQPLNSIEDIKNKLDKKSL